MNYSELKRSKFSVTRYHDISCGHRVFGHEGKCRYLHGHNYRIHLTCEPHVTGKLDSCGRVIDFGIIKQRLCEWLEVHWDHKMILWSNDPITKDLMSLDPTVVVVPFNPTAENMAEYLVEVIGPEVLVGTGVKLTQVKIDETAKCSATYGVTSV